MHDYRTHLLVGDPDATKDMYTAMCAFLHIELKLFIKLKNFFTTQLWVLKTEQLSAIAQAIRDEFPIHKFNEILMEYFDACMAASEGNVAKATELTKNRFEMIQEMLRVIRPVESEPVESESDY